MRVCYVCVVQGTVEDKTQLYGVSSQLNLVHRVKLRSEVLGLFSLNGKYHSEPFYWSYFQKKTNNSTVSTYKFQWLHSLNMSQQVKLLNWILLQKEAEINLRLILQNMHLSIKNKPCIRTPSSIQYNKNWLALLLKVTTTGKYLECTTTSWI